MYIKIPIASQTKNLIQVSGGRPEVIKIIKAKFIGINIQGSGTLYVPPGSFFILKYKTERPTTK